MDLKKLAFLLPFAVLYLLEVGSHPYPCYIRDCQDVKDLGFITSGVYEIYTQRRYTKYDVYCDMTTDGGGWTVFQRRLDGSVDFNRTWAEYIEGFGDPAGEHWLGNQPLKSILSQGEYELLVEFKYSDQLFTMKYGIFDIEDYAHNYKLSIGLPKGLYAEMLLYHHRSEFSTIDHENNPSNCSEKHTGGWWFNDCRKINLNGLYGNDTIRGMAWNVNLGAFYYPINFSEMKIKRA